MASAGYQQQIRIVLLDIIGTISPLSFSQRLRKDFSLHGNDYLSTNRVFKYQVERLRERLRLGTNEETVGFVSSELEKKNKEPEYMELCGIVNMDGFEKGRLAPEFYEDVKKRLETWKADKRLFYTLSNISDAAQEKILREAGLELLVDWCCDTMNAGSKESPEAYQYVAQIGRVEPKNMVYLCDNPQELDAAKAAGCPTVQVIREGDLPAKSPYDMVVRSFDQIDLNQLDERLRKEEMK